MSTHLSVDGKSLVYQSGRLAVCQSTSRRAGGNKPAALSPLVVRGDHHDGLLPKFAGDDFRDTLGAPEDAGAASAHGGGGDLNDEAVFPLALPNTATSNIRRAGKRSTDETLDGSREGLGIERSREAAVPTRLARNAASDEEANRAHRFEIPPPYRSLAAETRHAESVTQGASRAAYDPRRDENGRDAPRWLTFETVEDEQGRELIEIHTCWLPDLDEPRVALPSEFVRQENGSYVAHVLATDEMKIARLATKALHAILRELRGSES